MILTSGSELEIPNCNPILRISRETLSDCMTLIPLPPLVLQPSSASTSSADCFPLDSVSNLFAGALYISRGNIERHDQAISLSSKEIKVQNTWPRPPADRISFCAGLWTRDVIACLFRSLTQQRSRVVRFSLPHLSPSHSLVMAHGEAGHMHFLMDK